MLNGPPVVSEAIEVIKAELAKSAARTILFLRTILAVLLLPTPLAAATAKAKV